MALSVPDQGERGVGAGVSRIVSEPRMVPGRVGAGGWHSGWGVLLVRGRWVFVKQENREVLSFEPGFDSRRLHSDGTPLVAVVKSNGR